MKKKLTLLTTLLFFICYSFAQENRVSFLFAGDAMQHQSQLDVAKTDSGYNYSSYFKNIKDQIENVDIAVVNLEVTLPGKKYTGYPCFGSPDAYAESLKGIGFDLFLNANNHCLDRGKSGLERTIKTLDSLQIRNTGTFLSEEDRNLRYPLMMIKNGIRIAMLNYTYGTNGLEVKAPNIVNYIDKKQILKDIKEAQLMKADIIVANMHWGYEYKLHPNKEQKDLANFLIDNGVRLVIGKHPHVVQPIDIRKTNDKIDAVIVYSMGNFISGMKLVDTMGGLMASVEISKDEDGTIHIDDCSYSLVWTHKLMKNKVPYHFELIPVDKFENEEGKKYMGEESYNKMLKFASTARKVIESMWDE